MSEVVRDSLEKQLGCEPGKRKKYAIIGVVDSGDPGLAARFDDELKRTWVNDIEKSFNRLNRVAVIDANVLFAIADVRADRACRLCSWLEEWDGQLVVPAMCAAEATYLMETRLGPLREAVFLETLEQFEVMAPEGRDWRRIAELVRAYADFPLGGTDASVVALAERLNTEWVMTLDRRHFAAVRPSHVERLRLLP